MEVLARKEGGLVGDGWHMEGLVGAHIGARGKVVVGKGKVGWGGEEGKRARGDGEGGRLGMGLVGTQGWARGAGVRGDRGVEGWG